MFSSFVSSLWNLSLPSLAQGGKGLSSEDRSEIFFWLTVLIIVAVVTSVAGYLAYRKVKKADERTEEEEGFSLSQMRRLYEAGEISHEEYVQVRERILTATKASMLGESNPLIRTDAHDMKAAIPASPPSTSPQSPVTEQVPETPIDHAQPPTADELKARQNEAQDET